MIVRSAGRARASLTGGVGTLAKCMGMFIGGTGLQRGRNGSGAAGLMCCDNPRCARARVRLLLLAGREGSPLTPHRTCRCTKCDFKVCWFPDKEWDSSVDYLFFRNNFPTVPKLSPMLHSRPGSTAYCCQCSWSSVTKEKLVDYGGDLRWVCAGHG
jgi:hypothetical protein